jgi:translation initiation factor IF-3
VNDDIRIPRIRVISPTGEQIGVMKTEEAMRMAREQGLDLVEVAPNSTPPVCRLMDYGKYRYEQTKKEKAARKRQHAVHLKEITLRPRIEEHDYQVKLRHIREFLSVHSKVKVTVRFRGREMMHSEAGERVLNRMAGDIQDIGKVEQSPRMEGRNMVVVFAPLRSSTSGSPRKSQE